MPYKEKPIEKKYWTIGEVAKMHGTTTSHLRFLEEDMGLSIRKNRKDNRIYTRHEIDIISKVVILNNLEVPLRTIKHYGLNNLDKMIEFFKSLQ